MLLLFSLVVPQQAGPPMAAASATRPLEGEE
jgi:hypothetical protein